MNESGAITSDSIAEDYLKKRLIEQQQWHSTKAAWNRKWFYITEAIALVTGALIPVVNVIPVALADSTSETLKDFLPLANALMGTSIVIAVGVGKLWKFQENWLQYRALAETLLREKELFSHEVGEYQAINDKAERKRVLVDRVEELLASSTSQYVSRHRATPGRSQEMKDVLRQQELVKKESGPNRQRNCRERQNLRATTGCLRQLCSLKPRASRAQAVSPPVGSVLALVWLRSAQMVPSREPTQEGIGTRPHSFCSGA